MEQQNDMLKSIATLSEDERLALFNVEELENRLEMGGTSADASSWGNGVCPTGDVNGSC